MNIQQIIYVMKVYEHHSFTEAAKALYISQPRLSQAIRELEEELGFDIFVRNRKGISGATVKGTEFIDKARVLLRQFKTLESLKERNISSFHLASTTFTHAQDAFLALCAEQKEDPLLNMDMWFCGCFEASSRVISMSSEIGVVAFTDDQLGEWLSYFNSNHLTYHELICSNIYVTLSKDSPLAGKDRISAEDLEDHTYIADYCSRMNDNSAGVSALINKICPEAHIIVSSTDVMYRLLSQTSERKSFVFDPIPLSQETLDKYNLVCIPSDDLFSVHTGYISRTDKPLSDKAARYVEILAESMPM